MRETIVLGTLFIS